ncbi:ImmA/IrrE family metallo-endopeptidase [Actinomadura decatromicini]|nr:ImmA/IrrE family metallo-endopeptidase [Actinomadura decatromicini]
MSDESDITRAFNPNRLRLARERSGLTKEAFAQLCGVTRRAVSDWEAGRVENPPVSRISRELAFPSSFFYGEDIEEVPKDAVSFRALTSMSQRQLRRVLANASIIRAFSEWIDDRYTTPVPDVPSIEELCPSSIDSEPAPVEAAESLRTMWALGVRPIRDMLTLLESKGIRVFGIASEDREVDAFSFWRDDRPYILLNPSKSSERLRFDLAHELGHLCMHRGVRTNRERKFELHANLFASAFLIPQAGVLPQVSGTVKLSDIFVLKRYWRVSAMAMVKRLHQVGRISDWQQRRWMIDLTERGFRKSEPDGISHEQSSLLKQIMSLAREDGWSTARLSRDLGIPAADLTSALMGLTVTSVYGDREPHFSPEVGPPQLQVIAGGLTESPSQEPMF